jgi:membrane dipeptidase
MNPPNTAESSWLDAHLDLAYIALDRDQNAPDLTIEPDPKTGCVSWQALQRGGVRACCGTIFTEMGEPDHPCGYGDHEDREGAHRAGLRQLELYEAWERQGHLRIVRSCKDLDQAFQGSGPPAVVLLMECADPIRSPEEAEWWVKRGVSMVGLSWGEGSRYSGGNARAGGLTTEGRELVSALDDAGVAHDVSHLADQSVEDLLSLARGPIGSSHSNARSLLPESRFASRHLAIDHAREIAARGGVAGINLFTRFLVEERRAGIDDVLAHIDALAAAFGRTGLGLGTDMDGGFSPQSLPIRLEGPDQLAPLDQALDSAGWSDDERRSFRSGAWRDFVARIPRLNR